MNFLKNLFNPDVDSILSVFNKAVKQLDDLAIKKRDEASELRCEAIILESRARGAINIANRASTIAEKLKAVTSE